MKALLMLFLFAVFCSCEIKSNQPSSTYTITEADVYDTSEHGAPEIIEPLPVKKYVFAILEVKEPTLLYNEPIFLPSGSINETAIVNPIMRTYCSKIQEIGDFSEDVAYMIMDDAASQVPKLPSQYISDVNTKVQDYKTISHLLQETSEITDRKYLAFDSYKEATERRQKILNNER